MNWVQRNLSSSVRQDVSTLDGQSASIWAYPRGIPPQARRSVSLTPYYFSVFRDLGAFLRYRFNYRGAWIVEIREHSIERVVADGVFPNRTAGMAGADRASHVLPTLRLRDVSSETLKAPARVE